MSEQDLYRHNLFVIKKAGKLQLVCTSCCPTSIIATSFKLKKHTIWIDRTINIYSLPGFCVKKVKKK